MKKLLWLIPYMMILVLGFYNVASAFEALIRCAPYTDAQPLSETGDVRRIQDDNAEWGCNPDPRCPPNQNYIIVQVTDVPADDPAVQQYYKALLDETDPNAVVIIKERQYKFDITCVDGEYSSATVPSNVLNQLKNNNGFLTVNKNFWNSVIENKEGQL